MQRYYCFLALIYTATCINYLCAQPTQKTNVIFILADDVGYDVLGVNGGQSFNTPNLDSMAHNGINFTHCESSPLCSPSRVMLLTGKHNFRNYHTWAFLLDTAKTMGNLMRDAGYNTGFFGKFQLPLKNDRSQVQRWGWNKYTLFEVPDDTLDEHRYKTPTLIDNAGKVPDNVIKNKYCDDILTNRILDFIDSNKTKPFFIYYSMSLCHKPFCPTPDDPQYAGWDPASNASDTNYFRSMVKYMDKKVGEILAKLRSTGLDKNTIVFFAGDNGTPADIYYYANGYRVRGQKAFSFERGTHVPLIAYMPSYIAPRSVNDDLIDFTDFFPTFAALAKYSGLGKFGALDGSSIYNRLFNKNTDSVKSYIFSHYAPYHSNSHDSLKRWVRNKQYKLYDSTGSKQDGKFFNIKTDQYERSPIPDAKLSPAEKALKASFKTILDTTPTWQKAPVLINCNISNITSITATISATVLETGATPLMERGVDIRTGEDAYYYNNNIRDSNVATGNFSQKRTKLYSQTKYFYSIYGRNKNTSHSITYNWSTFFTLSSPPYRQSATISTTARACAVQLNWDNAGFPAVGATKGGYVVFYSPKPVTFKQNANGHPPAYITTDPTVRRFNIQATLPSLPATTATISGLSPDTLYYFTVVPYTWNGKNDSTYNYLLAGALTTGKKPLDCGYSSAADGKSTETRLAGISVTPNPSNYQFSLRIDHQLANELINIQVSDAAGRIYYRSQIKGQSTYTFGSELKAGVYIVHLSTASESFELKLMKE